MIIDKMFFVNRKIYTPVRGANVTCIWGKNIRDELKYPPEDVETEIVVDLPNIYGEFLLGKLSVGLLGLSLADFSDDFSVSDIVADIVSTQEEFGTLSVGLLGLSLSDIQDDFSMLDIVPNIISLQEAFGGLYVGILGVTAAGITDTAEFEATDYSLTEYLNTDNAYKYSYNPDWVEFTEDGAYLRDKAFISTGGVEDVTENGTLFAVELPDRQSYGNLDGLSVELEVGDA